MLAPWAQGYPIGRGGEVIISTLLGREMGAAFFLFLIGAIGASVVALATRKNLAYMPGLKVTIAPANWLLVVPTGGHLDHATRGRCIWGMS